MKNHLTLAVLLFFVAMNAVMAQDAPPKTDIYVLDLLVQKLNVQVANPERITDGLGYNNQPFFMSDDSVFYTSIKADGQADIYLANWSGDSFLGEDVLHQTQITKTKTKKEYSCQWMTDKKSFTVVQVQADDSTQWLVTMTGKDSSSTRLLPLTNPVGYYCWVDEKNVAAFVLGVPDTLVVGNAITGKVKPVAYNIGRCILKIPNEYAISFVDKTDSNNWIIKRFDMKTNQTTVVANCISGSEDYTWTPDGTILCGSIGILYKLKPGFDKAWMPVQDFNNTELQSFYRLVVSPDGRKLAVVVYSGKKP